MVGRAAVLLALLLAACGPYAPRSSADNLYNLVIRQFPDTAELARIPIPADHRFSLTFIHSVSGTPVRDDYTVENGSILQVAEAFETHEAGLPSLAQEADALAWEFQEGRFLIHLRRPIPHLVMRTNRQYCNRLWLSSGMVDLNQWPDQALELTIEPVANHNH